MQFRVGWFLLFSLVEKVRFPVESVHCVSLCELVRNGWYVAN
jgi:hypothetical protein